jgi:hypothetical protein
MGETKKLLTPSIIVEDSCPTLIFDATITVLKNFCPWYSSNEINYFFRRFLLNKENK